MRVQRTFIAIVLTCMVAAQAASAALLDIAPVTGTFATTENRGGTAVNGQGTSGIDWGRFASGSQNSSYRFAGRSASADTPSQFVLGRFTHHNGDIYRSDATLARTGLDIAVKGSLAGEKFNVSRTVTINHTETINQSTPCELGGPNYCRDGIGLSVFDPFSFVVEQMGFSYSLQISGLYDRPVDGDITTSLITPEYKDRHLYLVGSFTRTKIPALSGEPPVVPLPATGLLLGAALAMAGATRLRRRARA